MNATQDRLDDIDRLAREIQLLKSYLFPNDETGSTLHQDMDSYFEQRNHDLEYQMWKKSAEESAELAIKEFVNAKPFFTKNDKKRHDFGGRNQLLEYAIAHAKPNGLYMEFGVYNGESINFISSLVPGTVYGFDSFQGLPTEWFLGRTQGHLSTHGKKPPVNDNVRLIEGWFDATIPEFLTSHNGPISFMHLDCDVYISAKHVLEATLSRVVPGTILVFDEFFNYPGWQFNEYRAFREYVDLNSIKYRYLGFTPRHYSVAIEILG